jgi:hypothetical protein
LADGDPLGEPTEHFRRGRIGVESPDLSIRKVKVAGDPTAPMTKPKRDLWSSVASSVMKDAAQYAMWIVKVVEADEAVAGTEPTIAHLEIQPT